MRQYSNDIIGHLHWLAAHGKAATECAVLMGMFVSALSNLRKRLHSRMFGISGGAREFDEKIRLL